MVNGTSLNIALYLFLAGSGSGMYQMLHACPQPSGLSHVRSDVIRAFDPLARAGSIALVLAGTLFLLVDLGVPDRFFLALSQPTSSAISFGAWAILLFVLFGATHLFFSTLPQRHTVIQKVLDTAATLYSFAVSTYTGYYLYSVYTVAFWHTTWIIVLFFASALSSGTALLVALSFLNNRTPAGTLKRFATLDSALILIELTCLTCFLVTDYLAGGAARTLAMSLLAGDSAFLFWIGVVGTGLLAPVVLGGFARREPTCYLIASCCAIIGGLLLRCSIILI